MEIKPVSVTKEDEKVHNDISTWRIVKIRRNIDTVLNELEDNDEYIQKCLPQNKKYQQTKANTFL